MQLQTNTQILKWSTRKVILESIEYTKIELNKLHVFRYWLNGRFSSNFKGLYLRIYGMEQSIIHNSPDNDVI